MSTFYVLNNIYETIYRYYGIKAEITEVEPHSKYMFNLGKIGQFVLCTDKFKNQADMAAFIVDLTNRINTACIPA